MDKPSCTDRLCAYDVLVLFSQNKHSLHNGNNRLIATCCGIDTLHYPSFMILKSQHRHNFPITHHFDSKYQTMTYVYPDKVISTKSSTKSGSVKTHTLKEVFKNPEKRDTKAKFDLVITQTTQKAPKKSPNSVMKYNNGQGPLLKSTNWGFVFTVVDLYNQNCKLILKTDNVWKEIMTQFCFTVIPMLKKSTKYLLILRGRKRLS